MLHTGHSHQHHQADTATPANITTAAAVTDSPGPTSLQAYEPSLSAAFLSHETWTNRTRMGKRNKKLL